MIIIQLKVDVLRALGAEIVRTPNAARFDAPGLLICVFIFHFVVLMPL